MGQPTNREIREMLRPMLARIKLVASRCVLTSINDAPRGQEVQVRLLAGELVERAERFQEYGFTSVPLPGAEGMALSLGGSRDHVIVVATEDRRYRIHLAPGECSLYDDQGQRISILRDEVQVVANSVVRVVAPRMRIDGDLEVLGDIIDNVGSGGRSMASSRAIFNAHVHPENDNGGPTDPPTSSQ